MSLGFSRQEYWSGLPFPSPMHESEVAQLCPTLRNPMDCSPPDSSVHGISQARVLEWGAIAFSDIADKFKQFQYYKIQTFLKSAFSEVQCLGCSRHSVKPCLMNFNWWQQKHCLLSITSYTFLYIRTHVNKRRELWLWTVLNILSAVVEERCWSCFISMMLYF